MSASHPLPVLDRPTPTPPTDGGAACVALVGNPNAGKTTLFNRLTGLNAKTANFPGTTLECRLGHARVDGLALTLLDLPGLYGLTTGHLEEQLAADALVGRVPKLPHPDAAVVVVDATALDRHLYLASQVRELGVPTLIALNMADLARKQGIEIDLPALSAEFGCPVVAVSARTGEGIETLAHELQTLLNAEAHPPAPESITACTECDGCPHTARHRWAGEVSRRTSKTTRRSIRRATDAFDRFAVQPVFGVLLFAVIMAGLFVAIFWAASYPMDLIEAGVAQLGNAAGAVLPEGDVRSFVVDGVIAGVGSVIVFLPQICILFFGLTLLEDTGYLARAALVMDRLMVKVGLPGKAFVPMLSAHACAIPAIMSTRVIDSTRDRLLTILILPLLTCSARLPVYAMVTALLFADQPIIGGLVFFGAYALGILAALSVAFVFKRTILPGKPKPLIIELPDYRAPSLRTALLTTYDRGLVFLKQAGTIILLISVVLWVLATYPKLPEDQLAAVASPADAALVASLEAQDTDAAREELGLLHARYAVAHSFAGRLGRLVEPVFAPLGFDWQINIGVLSSFAAREVVVATLAIVYGLGEDAAEDTPTLTQTLAQQTRPDGTPVFNLATSLSLLVFFVLAMQCLPTQAVARRETGSWKWPLLQLGYMTALAYLAALATYQVTSLFMA